MGELYAEFTIPAGWSVMLVTSAKQLNPDTFENPLEFNPWRWKVLGTFFKWFCVLICMYFKSLISSCLIHFRSLTRLLYQRISCLLGEDRDNALELSIVNLSWSLFSMSCLPILGTNIPFWFQIFSFSPCTHAEFAHCW